jgi:membrane protein required for colicin V production
VPEADDITMALTALDIAVIVVVLLSAALSLSRGAVREALTLLAWIGAFAVAWFAFTPLRPIVEEAVGSQIVTDLITAAIVFLVPLIVFKVVCGLVAQAVDGSSISALDKLGGLAFGLVRGVVIVSVAYLLITMLMTSDRQPAWVRDAYLKPQLTAGADLIRDILPRALGERALAGQDERSAGEGGVLAIPESGYDAGDRGEMDALIHQSTGKN